jgi:23S rRNA (adenine2030-N6)-methyltransferase
MNYRHAFHAGNPADCMKHALLVWMVDALRRKETPFFVLDSHAGVGRYELAPGGEWREGIALLLHEPPEALRRYVELVAAEGGYPGSPMLVRGLLRAGDGLACCELHPEDAAALRRLFRRDPQVAVHERDGYEAIRALLPPKQRRGLVLIDPPYEVPGEFDRVMGALRDGAGRFDHGIYAAWYPIKHRSPVNAFHTALRQSGLRDLVAAELWWRAPLDPTRLNGCGLVVRNAPHGFEAAAAAILAALVERLGAGEGQGQQVLRLADE